MLKHHWPDVPNLGDMTRFREWPDEVFREAAVIVAGTPCQAFSVAGRRRSLEDERGNLTLTFTQIIDHARTIRTAAGRPEAIILWENVPGCLSTKDNAFGCFLSELSGEDVCAVKKWPAAGRVLGEKRRVAWRIIDAQFAGVPQRRRRVFVIACNAEAVADSRTASPEQILFIGQGLRGDIEKSRSAEERNPAGAEGGAEECQQIANPLTARMAKGINTTLDEGQTPIVVRTYEHHPQDSRIKECNRPSFHAKAGTGGGNLPIVLEDSNMSEPDALYERIPPQKRAGENAPAVAHCLRSKGNLAHREDADTYVAVPAAVATAQTVRRLTPVECERLQGFPDNHTRIPWRGKPAEQCPDGSRYKALGNSMAVPVIRWLGQRIQAGSELTNLCTKS